MKIPEYTDLGPVRVYFGEKTGKYPDGNQVVVRGSDTLAIFDTPLVSNRVGADVDNAELVILGHVHEDHMAGLHRVPEAEVHVHELDLDAARSWEGLSRHYGYPAQALADLKLKLDAEFHYCPRPDAIGYSDEARWDLGNCTVRALHMPGHTAGHSVLLVEPHGIAFIGDIDLSSFGPYYGDACSSLADFRKTLIRVAEVPARAWITSHHKGLITDREQFLIALAAFSGRIDARQARLVELLEQQPRNIDELATCRVVYPPQAQELWVDAVERRCIDAHLNELLAHGLVRQRDDQRYQLV